MVLCGKQDLQIHEPFKFSEISCNTLFAWPNGIGKITKQRKYSKKDLVLYCIVHYRKYDPVLVLKSSHPNMLQSGNISPSNFVKNTSQFLFSKQFRTGLQSHVILHGSGSDFSCWWNHILCKDIWFRPDPDPQIIIPEKLVNTNSSQNSPPTSEYEGNPSSAQRNPQFVPLYLVCIYQWHII